MVALSGDGGFMYCATELSTAVKFGINVVTVVFNNDAFGASRWDQTHRFGERFIATDLHNPDLMMFAKSFGAVGIRTDPAGFGDGLKQAFAANAPVLSSTSPPAPDLTSLLQSIKSPSSCTILDHTTGLQSRGS